MVSSGALPDPSFLFAQALSGLTAAMFLFLIAAGLSLIFGVLRVLNFSHGSFYMLGAYLAYQVVQWAATTPGRFWWATIGAALGIAALGGAVDRLLLRHLGALGVNVTGLYTGVFVIGSFLAGLGGALVTPVKTIVPGMDVEIIVEAFIVVVIGGLGSFWGTFLGSIVYGQVLSFGILIFPRFSIFSVFALMAVVLIVRPWGLLGRPLR